MIKPGTPVYFYHLGWRTGTFLGIVEHTKSSNGNFGMYRIKANFLERKEVLVRPEAVELLEKKGVEDLLK